MEVNNLKKEILTVHQLFSRKNIPEFFNHSECSDDENKNLINYPARNEQTRLVKKSRNFIYQLIVNALMRVKIEFFRQKHYGKISSNDQCRFPNFYWTLHSYEVFLSNCVLWLEVLSQNGLKCFGRTYVFPPIFAAFSSFPQF